MKRFSAMIALSLALPVFAQGGPSFECSKASNSVEEMICDDAELADLDRQLAVRFADALDAAEGLDSGSAEAVDTLRETQRGWIGGRDDCWKAKDVRECVETAYLQRDAELVATWLLETPTGQATWVCDGNPANEVVTMFFDTALPSVRFERGDSIDVGYISRTASGARYDGSFGRYIWMKGDAATYREPDPDGQTVSCEIASQD